MYKYWKVKSPSLKKALQKFNDEVKKASDAVLDEILTLPKSGYAAGIDTNNIGTSVSVFGTYTIALKFTSPPESKYWKHVNSVFYVPKSVNPFYKRFKSLEAAFPRWDVEKLINMQTIRDDGTFCRAGLEKIGEDFYITTDSYYKGSPKLKRISDLELEAARSKKKAKS